MKNLMTKLKTLDYKQFFLQHGEKIGLGTVGIIGVVCMVLTTWSADITLTPEEMETQAVKVDTELKSKVWPETERGNFPLQTADNELLMAIAPVDLKRFEWPVEMSRKLYERVRPAGECEWLPPVELFAKSGTMPMAVMSAPLAKGNADEGPVKKTPKKGGKKSGNDVDSLTEDLEGSSGAGFGVSTGERAEGVRFNMVVGVINMLEQQKRLQKSKHLDSTMAAAQLLPELYLDFKIERQRAVPGPDPWTGPWRELDIESSINRIAEAADSATDIVHPKFTNYEVYTEGLPARLDTDWWSPEIAGHPRIPTLTEEEQEMEDQKTRAAADVVGQDADDGTPKKRGLGRVQRNVNRLRAQAETVDDGKAYEDSMKKRGASTTSSSTKKKAGGASGGGGGGRSGAGGSRGMGPPSTGMSMPGMGSMGSGSMAPPMGAGGGRGASMGSMGGMGMPGAMRSGGGGMGSTMGGVMGGGMMGADDSNPQYSLFRFIDFDVEPGECYRYRVKIEVRNPNFGETFVDSPSVAEGETRWSNWSEPSTAAVVEKDVNYALKKIYTATTKGNRPDGAELSVVQFDTNQGTLLSDTFKVPYGSFISKTMKSQRFNIVAQTLDDEEVNFSSKDVLLDSLGAPNLSSQVAADLKLDSKQFASLKKSGEIDLAVTVDRFGDIVELDASSNAALTGLAKG